MTRTYNLECPGCNTTFAHQADPEVLAAGDFDCITCLACGEEWEAEYEEETDTLELCEAEDGEECDLCGEPIDECMCDESADEDEED
jgi:hypothetical protein